MTRFTFMVTTVIISLTGILKAEDGHSQNLKEYTVSINLRQTNLEKVLGSIEKQTGFTFVYSREIGLQPINGASTHQISLFEALKEISVSNHLDFNQVNWMLKVSRAPRPQQPGRILGKILDDQGGPLPGANIRIIQGGQAIQAATDGSYSLNLKPGSYTLEISYLSFQTQLITEVVVREGKNTVLDVVMKASPNGLKEVVVTSSYKKASIASLYALQQTRAGLSDGISAEQIGATPDKHVGETLKRITGVSTTDNRKVVVRGIAERYNVSTLNGSTLPSTDVQERDFEFNLIPTNLVESIVVSKSITPDMPYGFAGGLVQIATKSVPESNFLSISAGTSFNTRTIGKEFMGYQRGKFDYLGFDDGKRNHFPDGIFPVPYDSFNGFDPNLNDSQNKIKLAEIAEQNKRIGGTERLGTRSYQAMPTQNYQLSIGRNYALSKNKLRSLGFVGSITYRNTQSNDYVGNMRRGGWALRPTNVEDPTDVNTGNLYTFNTTVGALLNGGFKTEDHQIKMFNLYTRIFDDQFSRLSGWSSDGPKEPSGATKYPGIQEDDRPKFSDLLQNKIDGSHRLGRVNVEWNIARTHLKTLEQDAVTASLSARETFNKSPLYQYFSGSANDPSIGPLHRDQYTFRERNLSAELTAAYAFKLGKTSHTFKTGANYMDKHAAFDWVMMPIVGAYPYKDALAIQEWGSYMAMDNKATYLYYRPSGFTLNRFEGKSINKGAFVMLDSKPLANLRIVGGVRVDYFRADTLETNASESSVYANMKLMLLDSLNARWLPSANVTYTPIKNLNVRVAYGESMVRPGLMENSTFVRFSPNYGTMLRGRGIESTKIKNYDAKIEWFPNAGEIISAGYFYKYFDKPAEYYSYDLSGSGRYDVLITNSDWAKVKGWEFEVRKGLGFIYDGIPLLKHIFVSGNLTLQESKVRSRDRQLKRLKDGTDSVYYTFLKYPRALYGQIPRQYNLGMLYSGKRLGINVAFNHMGYKTFITGNNPNMIEYERPRGQLDAQISYKLLKGKMEAKLNMSNLTDSPFQFYVNDQTTYIQKAGTENMYDQEWNDRYEYKEGFSEKFEKGRYTTVNGRTEYAGDRETFTRYIGRTFSFSVSYNF